MRTSQIRATVDFSQERPLNVPTSSAYLGRIPWEALESQLGKGLLPSAGGNGCVLTRMFVSDKRICSQSVIISHMPVGVRAPAVGSLSGRFEKWHRPPHFAADLGCAVGSLSGRFEKWHQTVAFYKPDERVSRIVERAVREVAHRYESDRQCTVDERKQDRFKVLCCRMHCFGIYFPS